jgi:hypothetical protein
MNSVSAMLARIFAGHDPRSGLIRCSLIIAVGLIAYSNTYTMAFNFDDAVNILSNPLISDFRPEGFKNLLQSRRSFGLLTFKMNYLLSGTDVFSYHLVNNLIHISGALAVFTLLTLLCQTPYGSTMKMADGPWSALPFCAALLFVAHPIQTQAVTYIVQRFASLATLLYLLAVICYLKARLRLAGEGSGSSHPYRSSLSWFAACAACCIAALLTKEIAYTIPVTLLMMEWLFFMPSRPRTVGIAVGGVGVAGLLGALVVLAGQSFDTMMVALDEATRVQTIVSRSDYLLTQFRVILTYVRLMVLPIGQSVEYDISLSRSLFEPAVFLSFLVLLALFTAACLMVKRSRHASPQLRLAAFGIFWFFITLTVESSLIPIIDLVFEHRMYLPSVGACTVLATSGVALGRWDRQGRGWIWLLFLLVTLVLVTATWRRNLVWTNETTLWEDATSKRPKSARSWNNLGGLYIKDKRPHDALKAIVRSIELDPSKASAWNNLGVALNLLGAYNDRLRMTDEMFGDPRAIEGRTVNAWLGDVNNNLGLAYEILGNLPKAAENFQSAAGFNPSLGIAYYNLGLVSERMGDRAKADEQIQILHMIDPVRAERLKARLGRDR